jgi:hypothetical protein
MICYAISRRSVKGLENVHICAKAPEDAFTLRPKVDKARKEPSKIKWMSASNVLKVFTGVFFPVYKVVLANITVK